MENESLSKDEWLPEVQCPRCKAWQVDFDGFGVLFCEKCGFCTHSSITGDTCDFCGAREADAYEAIGESRFGLPGGSSL